MLYAPLVEFIDPMPFTLALSLNLLLMVIVGGSGYFFGPFLGAMIAMLLPEWLRFMQGCYLIVYSVFVMVLLAFLADRSARHCRSLAERAAPAARRAAGVERGRAMSAVLEVAGLSKSFGGIAAVDGVSFEVHEGEILGIIGPNGSGKSTLFNCILGQLAPSAGEVRIDGKLVTGMRPCDLNRLGVSRTFQLLQVFPGLSVRENLILAGQEHQGNMGSRLLGRRDAGLTAAAERMISFFRLQHLVDEKAGSLGYGQQKLLDAAMAFMAGPRLVLLDEPAGGVNLDARQSARAPACHQCRAEIHLRGHRAQHGFRDVVVRAHPGARRRQDHRRWHARRSPRQSQGDRGLSWTIARSSPSMASSPATAR